jgi:hypothetical protein
LGFGNLASPLLDSVQTHVIGTARWYEDAKDINPEQVPSEIAFVEAGVNFRGKLVVFFTQLAPVKAGRSMVGRMQAIVQQ